MPVLVLVLHMLHMLHMRSRPLGVAAVVADVGLHCMLTKAHADSGMVGLAVGGSWTGPSMFGGYV